MSLINIQVASRHSHFVSCFANFRDSRMVSYTHVPDTEIVAINPPTAPKRITGKYKTILIGFLVLTIPLTALVAALLGLVFRYRVKHNFVSELSIQSLGTHDENGVLYVNLNPTFLMKVASLSSTIATFLTTFAVGMTAYPLASAVLTKTRDGMPDGLLTPYQYYLVLNLLGNGGIMSVWMWLKFAFSKRGKQTKPSSQSMNVGRVACITLFLG